MTTNVSSLSASCLVRTRLVAVFFAILCCAGPARAQDSMRVALPEIEVEAARQTTEEASAPFALAVEQRGAPAVALDPGLSLEATLRRLPGLWVNDRGHFALGERLSVRGMGWRAAFGVRGVQVVLDGIPLTMPDGQTVIDVVDPAFVRRAELIRGPASLFWGNGSGGTLYLTTHTDDPPPVRIRALGGSHGTQHLSAEAGTRIGRHRLYAYASDHRQDGFRKYSEGRMSRAVVFGDVQLRTARLRVVAAAVDQDTQSPGSITRQEFLDDPTQANARNVATRAGKQSQHVQVGTSLDAPTRLGTLSASVYGLRRKLDNPLSYAFVRLDRSAGGVRVSLRGEAPLLTWGLGADAGVQSDDRWNWNNAQGRPDGAPLLDQFEQARALAAFAHTRLRLSDRWALTAGVRVDHLRFSMDDHLPDNGDESGERSFAAWSPSLAVSYRVRHALLFAGYSTAFESPTTTELVNRPDLTGGFNPDLAPQRAAGFEVGARGAWMPARLVYDVAFYYLRVLDRLTPFQTPESGDRTFYRNSGDNRHAGIEVALEWLPAADVRFVATYTGSHLTYRDAPYTGNRLPGVPAHRIVGGVELMRGSYRIRVDAEATDGFYVDDANTEWNDGYVVLDVGIGHDDVSLGGVRLQPFVNVRNVLDARYAASVIVNASAGRYYEPAPGRSVQIGLSASL